MPDNTAYNRRKVLSSIGAGGAAAVGLAQTGAASDESDISISNLDGGDKRRVLGRANRNTEFRDIKTEFQQDGWTLNQEDSRVSEVYNNQNSNKYKLVVAKFEKRQSESEQRYIMWTDLDLDRIESNERLYQVTGHQFKHIEEEDWEVGKVTVQNNSVSTDTTTIDVADEVSTSATCSGMDECYAARTSCDSYNWSCILTTAGAYVTSIAACKSCAFASPSCLFCLGALLTSSGITVGCDYGSGCTTTYECTTYCND